MVDANVLIQAIAAIQAPPPRVLAKLRDARGYAFEAFVLVSLERSLRPDGWAMVHPSGPICFSRYRGYPLTVARNTLSHIVRDSGEMEIVPSVEWEGTSGVHHALDLVAIDTQAVRCAPSSKHRCVVELLAVVECKNSGSAVSLDVSRDLLGLQSELSCCCWRPEIVLVAANTITSGAADLLDHYGIDHHVQFNPGAAALRVGGLVTSLDFPW